MSLMKILQSKYHRELAIKLKTEFPRPPINIKKKGIEQINQTDADNSLIGTAYDYLLRFQIEFINKGFDIKPREWIATKAYKKIEERYGKEPNHSILIGYKFTKEISSIDLLTGIYFNYRNAEKQYKLFVKSGVVTIETLNAVLFLAKLDVYARARYIVENIIDSNPSELRILDQMCKTNDLSIFRAKKNFVLNPDFGMGSSMVGGADADLIIDGSLIEIKSTQKIEISRLTLNQLICYYFLSLFNRIRKSDESPEINKIGVFLSQHNFYWEIEIIEIIPFNKIILFARWFLEYLKQKKRPITLKEDECALFETILLKETTKMLKMTLEKRNSTKDLNKFDLSTIPLPNEVLDGGEYIEETKVFKLIHDVAKDYKPSGTGIESKAFDFALKALAIELNLGEKHGSYSSTSYAHLFNNILDSAEENIKLLRLNQIIEWHNDDVKIDYDKSFATNTRTNERIRLETIRLMAQKNIQCILDIQIIKIKMILQFPVNKAKIIHHLAGSTKKDYIANANYIFNDLITDI